MKKPEVEQKMRDRELLREFREHIVKQVPYSPNPKELYSAATLYKGFDWRHPETYEYCFDNRVYNHFLAHGKRADMEWEALARALHDYCITNHMYKLLGEYDEKKVVGVMGGHALLRTDPMYRKIVYISKVLAENGCLMVSGGGPGAMEATHLGAWLAGRTLKDVNEALGILTASPCFKDEGWLESAFCVIEEYPCGPFRSLGIPTFLYGHEPSCPFATHIAKYFQNSIREDEILTIAKGGLVFTPGSAGTMQEIFQDAVQNHYLSFGYASPMVFVGVDFWTNEMPVYPMLQGLMKSGRYKNLILSISDEEHEVVEHILDFCKS